MQYYNEISEGYEELHREEQEKKLAIVKGIINGFLREKGFDKERYKKLKLLDVGCGTGITSNFLEFGFGITGVDPAKKLLDKCRLPIKKIHAEAENMPLPDKEFDIVVSITAIQNFHGIEKGLHEIKRVGKDDALFVLTFLKKSPKKNNILALMQKLFDIEEIIEEEKDVMVVCRKTL